MSLADRPPGAAIGMRQSRILILDVERLPGTAYAWGPKTKYIAPSNFVEWPRLLCFAARWYGHRETIFESEWEDRDQMLHRAWDLYNEADVIVTYYGTGADNRWLSTEWLEAGFSPPEPWKDVDLYKVVRSQFGFESNSLDTVTKRLGATGKTTRYSMDLAWACVDGDEAAQRKMKSYNARDVRLTLWLYNRLRGWIPNHPHLGAWGDDARCPQCGSGELVLSSRRYKAVLLEYALYRCQSCGGNVRGSWEGRLASTRGVK